MKKNLSLFREYLHNNVRNLDPATAVFVTVVLVFGLFFVFKTPLLWGADETTHVGRVYQLAHGQILSQEIHDGYSGYGFGGYIPSSLKEVILYVNRDFNVNAPQEVPGVRWVDIPEDYNKFANFSLQRPLVQYNFSNTAIYSPISYAPSTIAFQIAAITDLKLGPTIFLGRIFDLMLYITIAGAALYALRGYKIQWLFFAIGLLPTMVYQASFINADAVTNTVAFALAALIAKGLLNRSKLTRFETYLMLFCAFLMPITKPTYIFISLLIFTIPIKKLSLPSKYGRLILAGSVVAGIMLYAAWQLNTGYLSNASKWIIAGVVPWWQSIDSTAQVKYVLGHPFDFIKSFMRTLLIADNGYWDGIFGRLGFNYVTVPATAHVLAVASVITAILMSERLSMTKKRLAAFLSVAFVSILAIFGTLYITISEVGQATIEGVQGRYFMPILPIILLILTMLVKTRLDLNNKKVYSSSIIVMMVAGLVLSAAKFYYVTWG